MTRDFRPPWTTSLSAGIVPRSGTTRPRKTWSVAVRYRPRSAGQRGGGICEIGPAKFPSYLFFEFVKARERRCAAWNLSRLIGQPLSQINVIIMHDVEPRFSGKLPVVLGEHAVHLGDLFIGTKAFCNHVLCSRRCRQPPSGFRGSPPPCINDSVRVGSISNNAGFLHRSSSIAAVRPGPWGIARASTSAACASVTESSSGRLFLAMVKKLRHRTSPC